MVVEGEWVCMFAALGYIPFPSLLLLLLLLSPDPSKIRGLLARGSGRAPEMLWSYLRLAG
jgi:hypothetical protein